MRIMLSVLFTILSSFIVALVVIAGVVALVMIATRLM